MPLPLPGSPSSNLSLFTSRLKSAFSDASPRVCAAFFLFGLINNVLYVIILTAALDLVGPLLPKSIILLADVLPSLVLKALLPPYAHLLPYRFRIILLVLLSFIGMLLVAFCDGLPARLVGIVLASSASGIGELSFLGLTSWYGKWAIPFWGSGTGAAGLVGAGAYVAATSWMGFSVRGSLFFFSFLPVIMLIAFFIILPHEPLRRGARKEYIEVAADEEDVVDERGGEELTNSGTLLQPRSEGYTTPTGSLLERLTLVGPLVKPYILPLLLVYIAEYTINLSLHPNLLFPLASTPFSAFRDFYPFYNTIYQLGVFISRSSSPFLRIPHLYPMSFLQCGNFGFLLLQCLWYFLPESWGVYAVFLVVFWEGLLGGGVYVNTFERIREEKEGEEREFALAACTVGDSCGIGLAGFVSLWLEGAVCGAAVGKGREWCRME